MDCAICHDDMAPIFSMVLLRRHTVQFYSCQSCGLLRSEAPYWLDEAYSEAIASTDTGLVARNIENSKFLSIFLELWFQVRGLYIDVAGGYGLLTRLMRDKGFDFLSIDRYCKPLFAPKDIRAGPVVAQCLLAFEVIEHLADPVGFLAEHFERYSCRTILFSTQTFQGLPPNPEWWYYSPETGQHITFYQTRTLEHLARRLGCEYVQIRRNIHLITDRPLRRTLLRCIGSKLLSNLLEVYVGHRRAGKSFTWTDHLAAKRELH